MSDVLTRGDLTCISAQQMGGTDNYGNLKWKAKLQGPDGQEISEVYMARKPGNDLGPGVKVFGRVEEGKYGPIFRREDRDQAPPPQAPQVTEQGNGQLRDYSATPTVMTPTIANTGNAEDTFAKKEKAKNRAIAYSVGLKAATDIALAGLPDTGEKREAEIKRMARAFAEDSLSYARGEE